VAGLQTYREKRRFDVTSEPRGKKARAKGHAFVIQKHAATRLHYDLRLELDGVMKSWAITRGPSLVPGEKRLAIHVEDHPIEYNTFEGTIPKGQYGGGTVMIWDRGEWFPEGDPRVGYKKGHLDFSLEGEKLHGRWHLVRMRKRPGERQDPWLLIKSEDDAARSAKDPDILEEESLSVATGRTMDEITGGRPVRKKSARKTTPAAAVWHSNRGSAAEARAAKAAAPRPRERKARGTATKKNGAAKKKAKASRKGPRVEGARSGRLPTFVPPALTVLSAKAPDASNWVHEIKFDGYRIQARWDGSKIALYTRRGLDWTERFQGVADALADLPADKALIDGEIVVETSTGYSSFSALQEELKAGGQNFVYYVFDLLHLDGYDLMPSTLNARKQALKDLLADFSATGTIRYSEHFEDKGSVILEHACKMDLEGIISKVRDAPYRSGRSGDWLKTKCSDRQEFVVVGYAPATNDPRAVGALIVSYYEDGELKYAGRVGTGYTHKVARDLWKKLEPSRTEKPPFKPLPAEERGRGAVWVEPKMVIEIDFRGWTHGVRLRHPSFKGVREDKLATDVVREDKTMAARTSASSGKVKAPAAKARPAKTAAAKRAAPGGKSSKVTVGDVQLTNPDRVYWEDVGLTKAGLADYYTQVWDWIAPHVVGRALSLVRCPEGTSGQCFFQKHASAGLDSKKLHLVPEDDDHVISIDDLDGLIALVQAGVLEIHVRGSTIDHLTECNRIIFDLDPSPECKFPEVAKAAREVRNRLEELNLKSFLKTTGGKGLHVVVPIAHTPWDEVKAFTKLVAQSMEAESPSRYIATASIKARKGKIFVDYLRNSREATAICAYSTRARPGATVSVPIAWEELGSLKEPNRYTVANLMKRLKTIKRDPWADIGKVKQKLPRLPGK
jgi:bifunctional non-homologous end joining protein LigD